jgi:hypothetical protein
MLEQGVSLCDLPDVGGFRLPVSEETNLALEQGL